MASGALGPTGVTLSYASLPSLLAAPRPIYEDYVSGPSCLMETGYHMVASSAMVESEQYLPLWMDYRSRGCG